MEYVFRHPAFLTTCVYALYGVFIVSSSLFHLVVHFSYLEFDPGLVVPSERVLWGM